MRDHHVVSTDNFGGDYPDEECLTWTDSRGKHHTATFTPKEAQAICDALNGDRDDNPRFYKMVGPLYQLQPGFEP